MIMPSKKGGNNERMHLHRRPLDGHVEALKRIMRHCPGSHWMPPSGDYSLRIAPAAARATANNTKM
jgi:hypothetical protein